MSSKAKLKHIGFIMDGNGRWAKAKGMARSAGHKEGFLILKNFINSLTNDCDLKQVSFYCFSTENWKRPVLEVKFLMSLFKDVVENHLKELEESNIQVNIKGDLSKNTPFDENLREKLILVNNKKLENPRLTVNFCINYGGRDEIVRAINELNSKNIAVTEDSLNKQIIQNDLPVDLIVRTSGEQRLSNFLLWQSAYSEFLFVDYHWPDMNIERYNEIKNLYYNRERRFGSV